MLTRFLILVYPFSVLLKPKPLSGICGYVWEVLLFTTVINALQSTNVLESVGFVTNIWKREMTNTLLNIKLKLIPKPNVHYTW